MLLKEIKEYMQTFIDCPNWNIGAIDTSQEKSITIITKQGPVNQIAVGGLLHTSYKSKTIEVILRWTNDYEEAENKAEDVYNLFLTQPEEIGHVQIISSTMKHNTPVIVETALPNTIEFRVETTLTYRK